MKTILSSFTYIVTYLYYSQKSLLFKCFLRRIIEKQGKRVTYEVLILKAGVLPPKAHKKKLSHIGMVNGIFCHEKGEPMKILVLVHVLAAVIGVGPTYFLHVLFRKNQDIGELRYAILLGKKLELFPKVGGTLAVLSGLLLFFTGNYGPFSQPWLLGSLVLYILIQVVMIGMVTPKIGELARWLFNPENIIVTTLPKDQEELYIKVRRLLYAATYMGTVLFILMILKP